MEDTEAQKQIESCHWWSKMALFLPDGAEKDNEMLRLLAKKQTLVSRIMTTIREEKQNIEQRSKMSNEMVAGKIIGS